MFNRLVDQRRPVVWWALAPFVRRYRFSYRTRGLADWQRVVLRRAIYLPSRRLLYVINAKAASSSLRDMMKALAGGRWNAGPETAYCFPAATWPEIVTALTDPSVYRFTFARHPVSRAVSSFGNLFVERQNGFEVRHIPYMRRTGLRFGDAGPDNFDRFLDYVEEVQAESPRFCDVHLRLQIHNLGVPEMGYDRIGHYERLIEDVRLVMAEAGVAGFREDMLGHVNPTGEDTRQLVPSAAQVRRIETIYAEDYARLGY